MSKIVNLWSDFWVQRIDGSIKIWPYDLQIFLFNLISFFMEKEIIVTVFSILNKVM